MGWKFVKMYEDNPAQDGEKWHTLDVIVKSNSCSNCVSFNKHGQIIEMELQTLKLIYEDLIKCGAID